MSSNNFKIDKFNVCTLQPHFWSQEYDSLLSDPKNYIYEAAMHLTKKLDLQQAAPQNGNSAGCTSKR